MLWAFLVTLFLHYCLNVQQNSSCSQTKWSVPLKNATINIDYLNIELISHLKNQDLIDFFNSKPISCILEMSNAMDQFSNNQFINAFLKWLASSIFK